MCASTATTKLSIKHALARGPKARFQKSFWALGPMTVQRTALEVRLDLFIPLTACCGQTSFLLSSRTDPYSISRDGLRRKARKPCNQGADFERKAGPGGI